MKLIVHEYGDPSVGVWDRDYQIDCPFEKDDIEEEDLLTFKSKISEAFSEFADGPFSCDYDFELEEQAKKEEEFFKSFEK